MAKRAGSQEIKCTVQNCKFHDREKHCTLNDIVVGTVSDTAKDKLDTECVSFECM